MQLLLLLLLLLCFFYLTSFFPELFQVKPSQSTGTFTDCGCKITQKV